MDDLLPYLLDFQKEIVENKDSEKAKAFWKKLAWEIETCAEAVELFPDMTLCPICLEHMVDGHLVHKFKGEIEN